MWGCVAGTGAGVTCVQPSGRQEHPPHRADAGGAAPVSSGPGLTVKHVIRRRSDFGGSEPSQNGGCKFSKSHTRHRCLELLE